MLGSVHVGGVEREQGIRHPCRLRRVGEGAVDHKDGKKGQEGVEANLVEALVGVNGVDEACKEHLSSITI